MADPQIPAIPGWQYGLVPGAAGLSVRSMERVRHPLGDALRIELADPRATGDEVHLQWVIATRVGAWAMWAACELSAVAEREAVLNAVTWFGEPTGTPTLAELRA